MKSEFWLCAALLSVMCIGFNTSVHSVPARDCDTVVSTQFGPVKGTCSKYTDVCVWRGVPYAAAPVGERRFKPPEDPEPWGDVYDATRFSPPCCQKYTKAALNPFKTGMFIGDEDCLKLNIWRPRKGGKFPVMVWIHGGTLLTGAGSFPPYRGDWLAADNGVMVITINYRLGPMGFLAHRKLAAEDTHGSSGNYGLLDQIKALKWIKNNIAAFGGDPDNVTIFGESAGGWSVCMLLASPLAKGLFHRAIMESGSCDVAATLEDGFAHGDKLVKDLDCPEGEELECLRGRSAQAIFRVIPWDETGVASPFKGHVDGYVLERKPINAIRGGDYNRVPFMAGSNRDEMKPLRYLYWRSRWMKPEKVERKLEEKYGKDAAQKILRLYPVESFEKPADVLFAAEGDARLGCSAFRAADAMSATNAEIFIYRFDFDDTRFPNAGAFHGMEIPFIFGTFHARPFRFLFKKENLDSAIPLSDAMMKYWTKFASTGNPNTRGLPEWPEYDAGKRRFLVLDTKIHVESFKRDGRCQFWKEYYTR